MVEQLVELLDTLMIDDDCLSNEEIAEALIANGVTVHKWIPVTERLPQEDLDPGELCEVVQVLLKDGSVTVGFCNRGMKCWFYMPLSETHFVGNHYDTTPVVAWQPLAEPPKGE